MCIRDRVDHPQVIDDEVGVWEFAVLAGVGRRPGSVQRPICLLYTSDAADERSSVDLGGRRIIKKKKSGTIRGASVVRHQNRKTTRHSRLSTKV